MQSLPNFSIFRDFQETHVHMKAKGLGGSPACQTRYQALCAAQETNMLGSTFFIPSTEPRRPSGSTCRLLPQNIPAEKQDTPRRARTQQVHEDFLSCSGEGQLRALNCCMIGFQAMEDKFHNTQREVDLIRIIPQIPASLELFLPWKQEKVLGKSTLV